MPFRRAVCPQISGYPYTGIIVSYLLVFKYHDGIWVSYSGLKQSFRVLRAPWRNDLETGYASVPTRIILRVLCSDTSSKTIRATESDVAGLDAARHVMRFCSRVDDLINRLHGEVECHEFNLKPMSA